MILISLCRTELAQFTNLENRTESDLMWLLIFLQSMFQFSFHMIKTLILHLSHYQLTLYCVLLLLMYMRNLLTALKNNLQITKNDQDSIANVAVDDDAQSFETWRVNNQSVNSLCANVCIGTTPTHKSLMRNFHTPVKNFLHQDNNIFVFKIW